MAFKYSYSYLSARPYINKSIIYVKDLNTNIVLARIQYVHKLKSDTKLIERKENRLFSALFSGVQEEFNALFISLEFMSKTYDPKNVHQTMKEVAECLNQQHIGLLTQNRNSNC